MPNFGMESKFCRIKIFMKIAVGRLSNRTFLLKVGRTGQFFCGASLTSQSEILGRVTVSLM